MNPREILFDAKGDAICHREISERIKAFGESYKDTTREIINSSKVLDNNGKVFIECASQLLKNFGMTRKGLFHRNKIDETLHNCWNAVGDDLKINKSVRKSGLPRDRYLVELSVQEREGLIAEIWLITKKLLPIIIVKPCFGLVGASKILFSILPEIVLPIDNDEWYFVFKTVDIGDVLHRMVFDIQKWEGITGRQLNDLDQSKRLTTLPSVYNVMAMYARPKSYEIEKNRM